MERVNLEALKERIYETREQVYAIRSLLAGRSGVEREIEQALFEAEYFLDDALHKIDPNLVS